MDYFLFRKLEIDGKNYYQFYQVVRDFVPGSEFTTFDKRNEKDYFFIREDNVSIDDNYLYYIFEDNNGNFTNITDVHLLKNVYDKFKEKYPDLMDTELSVTELKSIDELVDIVSRKIKFQDNNIRELVKQIYRNQLIMGSNLPLESKRIQKNNILFFGPKGNGKRTIVRMLGNYLDLPYAEIRVPLTLSEGEVSLPSVNEFRAEIAEQLLATSNNNGEINSGIVFIHEDFKEKDKILKMFANINGVTDNPFIREYALKEISEQFSDAYINLVGYVTDSVPFKYHDNIFDFGTITFIVCLDRDYFGLEDKDLHEVADILNKINCDYIVPINELTDMQKIKLLLEKNGILSEYRKYLASFGKKLMISKKAIEYLIEKCNEIDSGMFFLNNAIEYIIKNSTTDDIKDVTIDIEKVKNFVEMYLNFDEDILNNEVPIDSSIAPVYQKLRQKIVGQDKGLKNLLYNIIENRRMANKEDLEDPKQYIKNILVRGESGGGKTFIINNIAKILNIPCYIADATQYTEAGYVGADVTDMLVELYHNASNDLSRAEKGILVIDEIDKKSGENGRNSDVSRGAVLNSLLKIIEGAEISINVGSRYDEEIITFDTSRLTVICSGAFEGIEEIRDARIKKIRGASKVGFNNEKEKELTVESDIIDKDYVEFGMARQFMARIPVIVNLEKNTKESLKNIMLNSSASALKIESTRLLERGITLEFTDDFYDRLAEEALKFDIGVRGIDKVLQKILTDINIQDIDENIEKIILSSEVMDDSSKVILISKEKSNVKKLVNNK